MRTYTQYLCLLLAAFLVALSPGARAQLADITQPGDPIVGTSNNTPGSEGVANAIDNQPTKYLNFDRLNTGFTVTPRVGLSVVQCLTLTSANDAPERDPSSYTLEGSYDGTTFTAISSGAVPAFTNRFTKVVIPFSNNTPYIAYRLVFPTVVGPGGNSMQISEVELLGFLAPSDVTQPGDPIQGTSNNTPGSEGVANVIDNQPTKYLNFDRLNTGFTVRPSVGGTLVSGLTLTSANDAPERDPASYRLEGSLDGVSFFEISSGSVPAFTARFQKRYIFFPNARAYAAYRLVFPTVVGPGGNSMQISEVELLGAVADLPQDVTQPGDPIVGTSNNTPGSEGVANAIDNQPTKYLNFDRLNTGFTVTPRSGLTVVSGLTLTSANDAPERDPSSYTLEGSYDGTTFVAISSGNVPAFSARFQKNTILFANKVPYLAYRLVFPTVVGPGGNSMQISEVELLGVLAPTDVTVPGDPIVGTSNNTPGSEGVANAIDNQPTKYLNFDRLNTGFTVTPGVGDTVLMGLSLTSANDAPERDPSSYQLLGANDGVNYVGISAGAVPAFTARFQKRYVFFTDNTKSFKSYRLIFPTVVGPGGNSMQISEVELLGVTPGVVNTNEVDGLIRRQPQDTPVLLGKAATFRVGLTGPWKVQWYRNGQRIAGANNAVYTTPPATAGDDGAIFHAVVQSPQGVQRSDNAMLSIFTPSAAESIGLSWVGGGANGAPTAMLPEDITGFHRQAYWNNLTGGSGSLSQPTNSANVASSSITVNWATSGEWGAGTGNSDATERMLNGMATSTGTSEATGQRVTFSGVPAGTHSLFVYTVQVPQEFFNMDFATVTHDAGGAEVIQRRYIRPQNADEYNAAPGFSLVTSESSATRGVGNMLRFDGVQPGPDGVVEVRFFSPGRVDLPGGDPIRGPGVNAMQLVLNAPAVGAPPVITRQPVSANAIVGGQVTLIVEASGPDLSYQWLRNGLRLAGATSSELTLSNLQTNDAGSYSVIVSNPAGRVASRTAVVGVVASAQLSFGLVTYLPLNDGGADGLTAANAAPGGVAGRFQGSGAEFTTPGQVGNAYAPNGSDNYVLVPNYAKVSRAMTVAGWVSAFVGSGPIVNNWIEGQTTGSSGQFLLDIIVENGVSVLRGQIEVGPNRVLATAPLDVVQLDPFMLHHFAMTANGVTLNLYWDGQLLAAVDYLGTINATASIPWLAVGADLGAGNPPALAGTPFYGQLDEIGLWNRYLSDVEVVGLYNGGLAGQSLLQIPPVLKINRSPVAAPDSIVTDAGTPANIAVLANDTDPDAGDVLSLTSVTVPAHGTAVITPTNTVLYTPVAGYIGGDQFSYRLNDGHGGIASAVVTITVRDNIPPIVVCPGDQSTQAASAAGAVVTYVATASDAGGLRDFVCVPPSGSTFPVGDTTVVCTATDLAGNQASCSFKVTVTPPNQAPVAVNDVASTLEATAVAINVVANDSDPDNDALTVSSVSQGAHGSAAITPGNTVLYSPTPGYIGSDSFTYSISDGKGGVATAQVAVTILPRNIAPTADASATVTKVISGNNSNAVVRLDGSRSSDPDGDALTYSWLVDGSLVPAATGVTADVVLEVGAHTITLVVSDGQASATASVEVDVITAGEAVDEIIALINGSDLGRKNKRPLIASLKAAVASFDRGNMTSGANQLQAFQNKVSAQVGRTDPALAEALARAVQKVLDAVGGR